MTGYEQWVCAGYMPRSDYVPCGHPAVCLYVWACWPGKLPFGACREHAGEWAGLTKVGLAEVTPAEAAAMEVHGR